MDNHTLLLHHSRPQYWWICSLYALYGNSTFYTVYSSILSIAYVSMFTLYTLYGLCLLYTLYKAMYINRLLYTVNTLYKSLIYMGIFSLMISIAYKLLILLDIFFSLFSRGYKSLFYKGFWSVGLSHWYCWRNFPKKNNRLQTSGERKEHL